MADPVLPAGPSRDARPTRFTSFDPAHFPVPTGREEEWRFTPLSRLHGLHDGTAVADGKVSVDAAVPEGYRVDSVDRDLVDPAGLTPPADRVAAAAWAGTRSVTVVRVPPAAGADRPAVLTLRGEGGTSFGQLVVDVAPDARASVVVQHQGAAAFAGNISCRVGDRATLTLVSVQDWQPGSVHVGQHGAVMGRDSRFRSVVVTVGGALVRLAPVVRLSQPGGDAELLGLYFADTGQHLEHRLLVEHAAPQCRSRVAYKGAAQGDGAHTVWVGDVLIHPAAAGTDTYELNRNLLLTDGARADSVPNLEIATGEVRRAGHASATGRFDDEQLFYLQARGIPPAEARRLVVRGFFADILRQVAVTQLRERLTATIESELQRVAA